MNASDFRQGSATAGERPPTSTSSTRRAAAFFDVDGTLLDAQSGVLYIGYLRRKLEADGASRVIHTVRGVGYVARAG